MSRFMLGLALGVASLCGCASTNEALKRVDPNSAEGMYLTALQDLEDDLFPEAIQGFSDVKTKHPYSKFAALADLRIADTHFKRGRFLESVDAYRTFIKFHPSHEEVPYAMLQIGESHFEQIPSDWFMVPPSSEKDQASTRLAIAAFRDLVARYPDYKDRKRAQERLAACQRKLADHELYVADFYHRREKYPAAARRAEKLLQTYAGVGLGARALWIAADSRFRLEEWAAARVHLEALKTNHADSAEGRNALDLLRKLDARKSASQDQTNG